MEQQPNKIRPMLLSALAQLSVCLIVWNFHIPNPNILLFVVLSAVLVKCGYAAGIVSGLIAFLYSAFFFSTDHSFFLYTSLNFQKLIVIGVGIAANILLIGRLQWQFGRSSMEKMQAEAEEKLQTSVYKGYKRDKIEMRGDRAEMSDFPLYLNTVAGGLDRRDQTIGGFSFVVKIYAVPVVEIIG